MKTASRALVTVLSLAALVASSLVGAGTASAAPGDVTEYGLAAGSTPRDVALGSDNNMWVTGGDSNTIAKISPSGAVTAYALPLPANVSNPWGIAPGPDGNLWFTLRNGGKIGRMTTAGAVSIIDLPDASMRPLFIAAGPDGNMWFTEMGGRIGRVTMTGQVAMFPVPWANSSPFGISAGSDGSGRLYFTDAGADRIAFVLVDGTTFGSVAVTAGSSPAGVANIGGSMWFAMPGTSRLGQLVSDVVVLELAAAGGPTEVAAGSGDVMWVSVPGRNSVMKYSKQGAPMAEYPLTSPNSLPSGLAEGASADVWVAQANAGKAARILSGAVPVVQQNPVVTPSSGVRVGSTLSASDGSWSNAPTQYRYQWQACSKPGEANTCTNIPGATGKTYVTTSANSNQSVRVGVQGVNASGTGALAYSPLINVSTPQEPPKTVTGGQTVKLAKGVTLTLKGPKQVRGGKKRYFAVIANTSNIKGKVRITITDSRGTLWQVIARGRWLKPFGPDAKRALKRKRIDSSLNPREYIVRAEFTPTKAYRDDYPSAVMEKKIIIR